MFRLALDKKMKWLKQSLSLGLEKMIMLIFFNFFHFFACFYVYDMLQGACIEVFKVFLS